MGLANGQIEGLGASLTVFSPEPSSGPQSVQMAFVWDAHGIYNVGCKGF
jgi:hypothetical protein